MTVTVLLDLELGTLAVPELDPPAIQIGLHAQKKALGDQRDAKVVLSVPQTQRGTPGMVLGVRDHL